MIHPDTQLRYVNDQIGNGVFATAFIPKGTMVYIKDILEIEVSQEAYRQFDEALRQVVEKYSYIDERGVRIVSWDHAKYVNHCCDCNTMSTGYGFEIAIRDILPGEEITDEYGMFNLGYEMELCCSKSSCRRKVSASDLDLYFQEWDQKVRQALVVFPLVDQPLLPLMDKKTLGQLRAFQHNPKAYQSVSRLKWKRAPLVFPSDNGRG